MSSDNDANAPADDNKFIRLTITNVADYITNSEKSNVKVLYGAPTDEHKLVDADGNVTVNFTQDITTDLTSFTQTLAEVDTAETSAGTTSGGSTIDLKFTEALTSNGTDVSAIVDTTDLASAFQIDIDGRILDSSKFTLSSVNSNVAADDNKFITVSYTHLTLPTTPYV